MSTVFVKASRRAKAHTRRKSSIAQAQRLLKLRHKVEGVLNGPITRRNIRVGRRIQLYNLSMRLEDARLHHVGILVQKRQKGKRGISGRKLWY